jgi:DNA polymerase-3 subunit delta
MTPEQAIREAKDDKLRPIYLVVGEERHLAAEVVKALREATLKGAIAGLNEDAFTAGEASVDRAIDAARTLPMMARRRWVLVRGVERWESREESAAPASKGPFDQLAEYAKHPSPSTTLVLFGGKIDKRRRFALTAQKEGWFVACDPLNPRDLPPWIVHRVAELGNSVSMSVAELIGELAGPELGAVSDAVDRVCLYVGAGQQVTEDAVGECVVRLRPGTVWELVGAVGKRDLPGALRALDEVYDPADRGLRLVGVLAWSARQLLRFESATRAGLGPDEAAKRAGAPPFKARDLAQQIKRTARADLESWLEALASVDLALKGGSKRPPKAVLESLLIDMCRGGPAARA